MRALIPYVVVVALMAGGCSREAPRRSAPASSAPIAADPSATEDVPGKTACVALVTAVRDATLMAPGVVNGVASASTNADAPIADAGQRLGAAYEAAVSAFGTDGEPDAVAAVSAVAVEMSRVCEESGLGTVG